jgi:hypothetical protein
VVDTAIQVDPDLAAGFCSCDIGAEFAELAEVFVFRGAGASVDAGEAIRELDAGVEEAGVDAADVLAAGSFAESTVLDFLLRLFFGASAAGVAFAL